MIPFFQHLGTLVDQAWLAQHYDEQAFPAIAQQALSEAALHDVVGIDEIVDWVFEPIQHFGHPPWNTAAIGQPSIVLFTTPRFMVEALFWFDATTSIHDHAFSGAFCLIAGSSVHSRWTFREDCRFNSGFAVGALELATSEILRPGEVRRIEAGPSYIHQLFHLEMPSVTIVLRTRREEEFSPQKVYLLPGIALDPAAEDPLLARRLALIDGMLRTGFADVNERVNRAIAGADLRTAFRVLQHLARRSAAPEVFAAATTVMQSRVGDDLAELLMAAIRVDLREGQLISRRTLYQEPEHRLFLALLLLFPDRQQILSIIEREYPHDDPKALVLQWAQDMSTNLDATGIQFDELNVQLFSSLLSGHSARETIEMLRHNYDPDDVSRQEPAILDQLARIRESIFYQPLFHDPPGDVTSAPDRFSCVDETETYVSGRRSHVRALEADDHTSSIYLANLSASEQEFRTLLDGGPFTGDQWVASLRDRHRTATGARTGTGHRGCGNYLSNDLDMIRPGTMRDEILAAGLAVERELDFQNQANPLIDDELASWKRRTSQPVDVTWIEVRELAVALGRLPDCGVGHDEAIPRNDGPIHVFPNPRYVGVYRTLAAERAVDAYNGVYHAWNASRRDALARLADLFHTVVNGHLFVRVNASLAMTEINTYLRRMELQPIEHGHLDIFAFNLGYRQFREYFTEFVLLAQHSVLRYVSTNGNGDSRLVRTGLTTARPDR